METDEGKAIYRYRAPTAECVNALVRARYGVQAVQGPRSVEGDLCGIAGSHHP